jgi:hypothetical protein
VIILSALTLSEATLPVSHKNYYKNKAIPLPNELVQKIAQNVPLKDQARLFSTSKSMRQFEHQIPVSKGDALDFIELAAKGNPREFDRYISRRSFNPLKSKVDTVALRLAFEHDLDGSLRKMLNNANVDKERLLQLSVEHNPKYIPEILKQVDPSNNNHAIVLYAAKNGKLDAFKYLINDERVVFSQIQEGLFESISKSNNEKLMEILLKQHQQKGFERDFTLNLEDAASSKNPAVLDQLLKYSNAPPDLNDNQLLFIAVDSQSLKNVEYLLKQRRVAEHPESLNLVFLRAAENNHKEIINAFLAQPKVDTNAFDSNAFLWSVHNGNLPFAKELVRRSANVKTNDEAAIKSAIAQGRTEMTKYLMDLGLKPDVDSIRVAIEAGHVDTIRFLLDRPEFKATEMFSHSGLSKHTEMYDFLVNQKSVDFNAGSSHALANAIQSQNIEIVKKIINDKRFKFRKEWMFLNRAIESKNSKVLDILLNDGRLKPTYKDLKLAYESKGVNLLYSLLKYKGFGKSDYQKLLNIPLSDQNDRSRKILIIDQALKNLNERPSGYWKWFH